VDWAVGVRLKAGTWILLYSISFRQTLRAHPAPYPINMEDFPGCKMTGVKLTSDLAKVKSGAVLPPFLLTS
jgi:hypothetical protein